VPYRRAVILPFGSVIEAPFEIDVHAVEPDVADVQVGLLGRRDPSWQAREGRVGCRTRDQGTVLRQVVEDHVGADAAQRDRVRKVDLEHVESDRQVLAGLEDHAGRDALRTLGPEARVATQHRGELRLAVERQVRRGTTQRIAEAVGADALRLRGEQVRQGRCAESLAVGAAQEDLVDRLPAQRHLRVRRPADDLVVVVAHREVGFQVLDDRHDQLGVRRTDLAIGTDGQEVAAIARHVADLDDAGDIGRIRLATTFDTERRSDRPGLCHVEVARQLGRQARQRRGRRVDLAVVVRRLCRRDDVRRDGAEEIHVAAVEHRRWPHADRVGARFRPNRSVICVGRAGRDGRRAGRWPARRARRILSARSSRGRFVRPGNSTDLGPVSSQKKTPQNAGLQFNSKLFQTKNECPT